MSHRMHDAVGLELAKLVTARLRDSSQPLLVARENLSQWSGKNATTSPS